MGLIKAAAGAAGGVLADQWKEFFLCEALPANVLAVKGQKKTTRRSSNTHGDENIITTGSRIAVADGQCMLIVEQGKVVEVCAEPGEYTYDASTEPSIFAGNLGESIGEVFRNIGKRFTFGGEAPKDQRIYYFNTKELTGNKYGTPSPVPFRVVDQRVLALQILIPRILVQKLPECRLHTLPHLRRRRVREGHDQQLIDIHRVFRVRDHADDPLNEDRRLSASCCRRDKEIPVSRLNDFFLLVCPLCRHYRISFPSFSFPGDFFFPLSMPSKVFFFVLPGSSCTGSTLSAASSTAPESISSPSSSWSISFQISCAFIGLNLRNPYPSVFRSNPHTLWYGQ